MKRLHRLAIHRQTLRGLPIILSVTDKSHLDEFVLAWKHGAELISTGGTLDALRELGITVTRIEEVTGSQPKFGGRIKTLDEVLFTMILARLWVKEDQDDLRRLGLRRPGLIVMNPYNFELAVQQKLGASDIIEKIDIGGGAIPLSAIKSGIPVIMGPQFYQSAVEQLLAGNGLMPEHFRDLHNKSAMSKIADYYAKVAQWMTSREAGGQPIYREWDQEALGVCQPMEEPAGGTDDS